MSLDDRSITDGADASASEDAAVAQVLDEYLAGVEAGRPADPQRLLAEHPAIASQLRACLEVMHLAGRVAEDPGPGVANGSAAASGEMAVPLAPSMRSTWNVGNGPPPRVRLHDLDDDEPLVRPRCPEMPATPEGSWGRYQLQGEIARGGMGAVIKGRDVDLGRDLAIKVLLESHRANHDVVRRFVEEAQIGGQLQHPGIVPVYELGTCADRRPYFAMKLVKGRTLASLLQARAVRSAVGAGSVRRPGRGDPRGTDRPDAGGTGRGTETPPPESRPPTDGFPTHEDLPRFLSIFEQICQTMAYAHARGVIHRDLKPSNIMVGSFGEVQVMDWGLAKVLARGGVADESPAGPGAEPLAETVIMTVRTGPAGSGSESQAGSVLGTPAYMAPEQARGDVGRLDERVDVFGLGAILCEILTGRPPFGGSTREEVRARAARGDLAEALGRLDSCGADAELVALAKDCLAAQPERRPRDAGEVARRIMAYQVGAQERLKAAELARVEAQARAEEAQARASLERSRRHRTIALAAVALSLVMLGGGGWTYLAWQRSERGARVDRAASGVELLYAAAQRTGDDLTRWAAAREAAHALEGLLADAPDSRTRSRLTTLIRDVARDAAAAESDQKLLADLADIRSAQGDDLEASATEERYNDAFREARMDLEAISPAAVRILLTSRPPGVRVALAAALDNWAAMRQVYRSDQAGASKITEIARLADPDPWRDRLRTVLQMHSRAKRLGSLKELARSVRFDQLPAVSLHFLGSALLDMGDPAAAESIFREALRRHPGDVWINYSMAKSLQRLARTDEAIRYFMVVRSLRPEIGEALAHALERKGETDRAIAVFQDLTRLRPKRGGHLVCLGTVLKDHGRAREAQDALDAAIVILRADVGLKPDSFYARANLGFALLQWGKLDEAIAEYREAIRLKPNDPTAHNNLGNALGQRGKLDEAIAECREAIRLKPNEPNSHNTLGNALRERGQLDEAIAECREAIRLKPNEPNSHRILGIALYDQGRLDEAIAEFRAALRIKPDYALARNNLGGALQEQGRLDEAIAELRETLRLNPDLAAAHSNLGIALKAKGRLAEAISEYRQAIRLEPNLAEAHYNLGGVLRDQGKLDEAIAAFRSALRLRPNNAGAHNGLGIALKDQGKLPEAIAEFRAAIRIQPNSTVAHANLGAMLCDFMHDYDAGVAEFRAALRLEPESLDAHTNLGLALSKQGKLDEAIVEHRTVIRLKPDLAEAHSNLGLALSGQGKLDEAIAEYRTALRLKPDLAEAHNDIGGVLRDQGKLDEAIAEYRAALRLKPESPEAHTNLGTALRALGKYAEALGELRKARELAKATSPRLIPLIDPILGATEQQASMAARLPDLLAGKGRLSTAAEMLGFAQLCYEKKLQGASARFWSEAFQAQPKLIDDMQAQHRYNAACAAALAGCGQGKDDPPLDDAARTRWHKQAIHWLKADLAAWSKILESGPPQARPFIAQTLQHWKADPDLAGLRDPAALAELPEDEQKACRALWADVDALLARVQGGRP